MTNTYPVPDTIALAVTGAHPLSVYDGKVFVGHLTRRDDGFEAVGVDGVSYGTFSTMAAAAFSLPARETS